MNHDNAAPGTAPLTLAPRPGFLGLRARPWRLLAAAPAATAAIEGLYIATRYHALVRNAGSPAAARTALISAGVVILVVLTCVCVVIAAGLARRQRRAAAALSAQLAAAPHGPGKADWADAVPGAAGGTLVQVDLTGPPGLFASPWASSHYVAGEHGDQAGPEAR